MRHPAKTCGLAVEVENAIYNDNDVCLTILTLFWQIFRDDIAKLQRVNNA